MASLVLVTVAWAQQVLIPATAAVVRSPAGVLAFEERMLVPQRLAIDFNRRYEGDVLGLVGNSGAPGPHLHFQVTDGPGPMTSDGLPYVFDSFVQDGKRVVVDQMPMDGWVISFDGTDGKR
jgi:hypothetical protein